METSAAITETGRETISSHFLYFNGNPGIHLVLLVPSTTNRRNLRMRPDVPHSETTVFAEVEPIQPSDAASPCGPTVEAVSYEPAHRLAEGGERGGNRDRFPPRWVQG